MGSAPTYPPEHIDVAPGVVLRSGRVDDAEGIAHAIAVSLPELETWMAWAGPESADPEFQRSRFAEKAPWIETGDHGYVIVEGDEIVGSVGLHDRIGGGGREIGYWLRSDRTGRGIVTACVRALTAAALRVEGVERVEIHCDAANVRSAAVPKRVGYRLDRVERDAISAPGESGDSMIWIYPPG